jgi:anti-anti-sigma factor
MKAAQPFTAQALRDPSSDFPVRISCSGVLDMAAGRKLQSATSDALRDSHAAPIELSLDGVELIDSIGLQAVMEAVLRLDAAGRRWRICPSPPVQRLFKLVGLARLSSEVGGGWLASGGYGSDG